jgi:hypothetical protein
MVSILHKRYRLALSGVIENPQLADNLREAFA